MAVLFSFVFGIFVSSPASINIYELRFLVRNAVIVFCDYELFDFFKKLYCIQTAVLCQNCTKYCGSSNTMVLTLELVVSRRGFVIYVCLCFCDNQTIIVGGEVKSVVVDFRLEQTRGGRKNKETKAEHGT